MCVLARAGRAMQTTGSAAVTGRSVRGGQPAVNGRSGPPGDGRAQADAPAVPRTPALTSLAQRHHGAAHHAPWLEGPPELPLQLRRCLPQVGGMQGGHQGAAYQGGQAGG